MPVLHFLLTGSAGRELSHGRQSVFAAFRSSHETPFQPHLIESTRIFHGNIRFCSQGCLEQLVFLLPWHVRLGCRGIRVGGQFIHRDLVNALHWLERVSTWGHYKRSLLRLPTFSIRGIVSHISASDEKVA